MMLGVRRFVGLMFSIAAIILFTDDFVLNEGAMAEKIPLADAIGTMSPQDVWLRFYDVTQIPRRSGNEDRIREYLVRFGSDLGLETYIDDVGNVIIRRPAAPGMENRKGVILQAHMDMVADQAAGVIHDWDNDPIAAYVENDWVKAEGTTLGADDGIGMALAMAIMESNTIAAGPLEALFTVTEEAGMTGAKGLVPGSLTGDILVNLDGEIDSEFTIGCAGGEAGDVRTGYVETAFPRGMAAYRFTVKGLKGGHSGTAINLGLGNAAKLLVRFLKDGAARYGLRIAELRSGTAANAIPRDGTALVCIPAGKDSEFLAHVSEYEAVLKNELGAVETELSVGAEACDRPPRIMSEKSQRIAIDAFYATPQGVIRMSDNVADLVETSTNMGIARAADRTLECSNRIRSSVDSSIDDVANILSSVWELAGAEVLYSGRYPGWKPDPASPIVLLMSDVYRGLFGQDPRVVAIHAGLECGTIHGTYPVLDMISVGPTTEGVHSPDERLHVPSVQKVKDLLVETLMRVPEK